MPEDFHFECIVCNRRFETKHKLYVHSRLHLKVKPFYCKICKKVFRQRNVFKDHVKYHANVQDNVSMKGRKSNAKANVSMTSPTPLSTPKRVQMHSPSSQYSEFKCYICGEGFDSKDEVVKHVLAHNEPFELQLDPYEYNEVKSGQIPDVKTGINTDTTFPNLTRMMSNSQGPDNDVSNLSLNIDRNVGTTIPKKEGSQCMLSPEQGSLPSIVSVESMQPLISRRGYGQNDAFKRDPCEWHFKDESIMISQDNQPSAGPVIEIDHGIIPLDRDESFDEDAMDTMTSLSSSMDYNSTRNIVSQVERVISVDVDEEMNNDDDENDLVLNICPLDNDEMNDNNNGMTEIQITPTASSCGISGEIIFKPEIIELD